jgi:hypothetical protein
VLLSALRYLTGKDYMWAMPCDLIGEINRRSARVEEKLCIWSLLRLQAVSGSQLNPFTVHIGAQACFPDHSGEATAQTILVLSPQGTTRAGETRKLIRPVVKILRNKRILICEDHPKGVALQRPPRRRCSQGASLGAMPTIRLENGPEIPHAENLRLQY